MATIKDDRARVDLEVARLQEQKARIEMRTASARIATKIGAMALPPGERIEKIQAIGTMLRDSPAVDIDLALDTFGFPDASFDGDLIYRDERYRYILRRLADSQDAAVTGL